MTDLVKTPVFADNNLINLYHLNELYQNIATEVSQRMRETHQIDVPITSGIWGGTYLIAHPNGLAKRRIWRFYCIVNLPQNTLLDKHANMERLVSIYCDVFKEAFSPHLELKLKMWGGRLPFSNSAKPSLTLHMEDATETVSWLRVFFVWNHVPWEESIISDTVRIVKEYKEFFDLKKGPVVKDSKEIKYLLQDIIIIYRTLENASSLNLFPVILGKESATKEKPHPDIFINAAEKLGHAPSECFVLEDALKGLHAAREAGMPCIILRNSLNRDINFAGAELIFESLEDFVSALKA